MSDHPAGVSLTRLSFSASLSIPKSSLHGLLQTLVGRRLGSTDRRGTIYGIGLRALRIGATFLDRDPIVDAAGLVLTHVRSQINETVHLARLDGADVVYLVSKESAHHLRTSSRIGRRLPAHATAFGQKFCSLHAHPRRARRDSPREAGRADEPKRSPIAPAWTRSLHSLASEAGLMSVGKTPGLCSWPSRRPTATQLWTRSAARFRWYD